MKKINYLQMYVFVTLILVIGIRSSNAQSTSAETFCDRNPSAPDCIRKAKTEEAQPRTKLDTSTSGNKEPAAYQVIEVTETLTLDETLQRAIMFVDIDSLKKTIDEEGVAVDTLFKVSSMDDAEENTVLFTAAHQWLYDGELNIDSSSGKEKIQFLSFLLSRCASKTSSLKMLTAEKRKSETELKNATTNDNKDRIAYWKIVRQNASFLANMLSNSITCDKR